jgi:penicillin amidase
VRRVLRLLLSLVLVVLIVAGAGLAYGYHVVRRPWPQVDGTMSAEGLEEDVSVVRDEWGVPHIYAATSHDLFFAQGFVHAQDRFWQMEFSRRAGSGRLSEVLGEAALESDRFIRTVGWHRTAARELELLDQASMAALEAYAEGVNAYIASKGRDAALELAVLRLTGARIDVQPWTPLDTLCWAKVMSWELGGNMQSELLRAHIAAVLGTRAVEEIAPPYPEGHPIIVQEALSEATIRAVPEAAFSAQAFGQGEGRGSNGWVVAGSLSETGMPILANDPHLGIQMPSIWYEIGLHCDPVGEGCPFNVAGASFAGAPGVIVGHNDHVAWGVTNLGPDVQDLFVEKVNPADPNQYEYRGQWLEMEIVREEIQVAGRDEPEVVLARITRHGPIINDVIGGTEDEWALGWQPLALSWTALQPGSLIRSVLALDQAEDWSGFRDALSHWDVPSQNFVYADVQGNIGYQAPGRIPIRASGDGSTPAPGWTGEYEWVGYIPFDQLPYSYNPPQGYIVTANNRVVGPEYSYTITTDWAPGYRARRIVELIEAQTALSAADMEAIQLDCSPIYAERVLPHLTELSSDDETIQRALELLGSWDGRASRDSAGAALFEAFRLNLVDQTFGDEMGDQLAARAAPTAMVALVDLLAEPDSHWFDDVTTPEVEGQEQTLVRALEEAVAELSEILGDDMNDWRWGNLHAAEFRHQCLGECGIGLVESVFNRGPFEVDGTIATVNNTGYSPSDPYAVVVLPSYRQVIDLSDLTRSVSMHTTGQSGHPFHEHYDDMIDPWRNGDYHAMLWDRADVEQAGEHVLHLSP